MMRSAEVNNNVWFWPRPVHGLVVFGLLLSLVLVGCPKSGDSGSSGSASSGASDTWVVFEIYEAGTGNALSATVWPVGLPEDFDSIVQGNAGSETKFYGVGLKESGYALTFGPGSRVSLMVWSPGHELKRVDSKLKKGENLVAVELKRTEVEDERVPERIRLEVLESLPTEGPRTGS